MRATETIVTSITLQLNEEEAAYLATVFGAVTANQVEEVARIFRELPPDFREKMHAFLHDGWVATKAYRFPRKQA